MDTQVIAAEMVVRMMIKKRKMIEKIIMFFLIFGAGWLAGRVTEAIAVGNIPL